MGSVDRVDDRTFKVDFSGDGVEKLRKRVEEKLKEFMGDYTDDTLVEYVIVLLRNGRRKEEARNELNVFLGDDSDSFVSWLWDHLASSLDLYVESQGSDIDEVPKTEPTLEEQAAKNDLEAKSDKLSRSRRNKEWRGLARDVDEPPPLRSSEIDNYSEEKTRRDDSQGGRSPSHRHLSQRKRSRHDEHQNTKRDAVSQVHTAASRRLLQFAVRDAVAPSRPSNPAAMEPASKRLRSVVSTSMGDSTLVDRRRRLQSVARVPNPMATVIKAVAEAADDVTRVKSSSVFDRLSRDLSDSSGQPTEYREAAVEDGEYEDVVRMKDHPRLKYPRSDYSGQFVRNTSILQSEVGLVSDSTSDNEGYDDANTTGHRLMDASQTGSSGGKDENSLMLQYSVAKNPNDIMRTTRNTVQNQPAVTGNTSSKIVNISVNVNTWKPPYYQEPRKAVESETQKVQWESGVGARKSILPARKENDNPITVGNGNEKPFADSQKESQKPPLPATGHLAAARPLEDVDSRTIFVSNVHFAATKDSLSRHFNKFGDVLKVIIITDAATGQPKGAAYVEFMRKEAADNALSLDGTSFMSRILKVVKRSSANHQEAGPVITWPRIARAAPFTATRFGRVPFSRGIPTAFRPHSPIKPAGARSFQWKRDAQASPADSGASGASVSSNAVPPLTPRSLTYVRSEAKPDGNLGTA